MKRISERHLCPRETDILRELVLGKANKQIAYALGLTLGTVKIYFYRLAMKLGGMNRVEMALWAERQSLLPEADRALPPLVGSGSQRDVSVLRQLDLLVERMDHENAGRYGFAGSGQAGGLLDSSASTMSHQCSSFAKL